MCVCVLRQLEDVPRVDCGINSWHCVSHPALLLLSKTAVTWRPASWRPACVCVCVSAPGSSVSWQHPAACSCRAAPRGESHRCPDAFSCPFRPCASTRDRPRLSERLRSSASPLSCHVPSNASISIFISPPASLTFSRPPSPRSVSQRKTSHRPSPGVSSFYSVSRGGGHAGLIKHNPQTN